MVDISVTAASVAPVAGSTTINKQYNAGATITAGQCVYLDTANSNVWKLAQDDGTALEAGSGGLGIALHGASSGQPLAVATAGNVTFNAVLTAGETYIVSATAGGIAPVADISTNKVSYLGYGTTTTNLALMTRATGVTHS